MPIQVTCPNPQCQTLLTLGDALAGKETLCSSCGKKFQVPTSAPQTAPMAQAVAAQGPAASQAAVAGASGASRWVLISSLALSILVLVVGAVTVYSMNGRLQALRQEVGVESEAEKQTAAAEKLRVDGELQKVRNDLENEERLQQQNREDLRKLEFSAMLGRSKVTDLEQQINTEKLNTNSNKDKIVALERDLALEKGKWQAAQNAVTEMQGVIEKSDLKIEELEEDAGKLEGRIATLELKKYKDQKLWDKVKNLEKKVKKKPPVSTAENVVTVFGEDKTGGPRQFHAFTLDTRTGFTKYSRGQDFWKSSATILEPSANPAAVGAPGRYDMKVTFKNNGDVYDVVRLDTQTGRCWCWRVGTPKQWKYFLNQGMDATSTNVKRFRLDVDASNSLTWLRPFVIITDTANNFAWSDAGVGTHRNNLFGVASLVH